MYKSSDLIPRCFSNIQDTFMVLTKFYVLHNPYFYEPKKKLISNSRPVSRLAYFTVKVKMDSDM